MEKKKEELVDFYEVLEKFDKEHPLSRKENVRLIILSLLCGLSVVAIAIILVVLTN